MKRIATRPRLASECRATHASGLHCTLPIGHDGDHVAQEFDPRDVLRWPVRAELPPADPIDADLTDDIDDDDDDDGGQVGGAPGDLAPLRGNGAAGNR
jgi:hypothetical protein